MAMTPFSVKVVSGPDRVVIEISHETGAVSVKETTETVDSEGKDKHSKVVRKIVVETVTQSRTEAKPEFPADYLRTGLLSM